MSRIFISYKRVDKDKVFKIKDQIEVTLGEKCWIDLDGIESDAQFASVIIDAIDEAEVILFMHSIAHTRISDFENDWTVRDTPIMLTIRLFLILRSMFVNSLCFAIFAVNYYHEVQSCTYRKTTRFTRHTCH